MFRCSMLVVLGKGLGRLGLLFRSLERQNCTALHSLDLTEFYVRLQLFGRLIRKSWTACRDCLMITMSDWTSSSKNPTSWWQLTKRIRRTTVTCWIVTDWWMICNLFLVARTCIVWCLSLKVLILCSHILHLRLEILSCHYSEVLERFLPLGDLHWDGWSPSQVMSIAGLSILPTFLLSWTHDSYMTCDIRMVQQNPKTFFFEHQHVNHYVVVDLASTYAKIPQELLRWKQPRCLVIWCSRQEELHSSYCRDMTSNMVIEYNYIFFKKLTHDMLINLRKKTRNFRGFRNPCRFLRFPGVSWSHPAAHYHSATSEGGDFVGKIVTIWCLPRCKWC